MFSPSHVSNNILRRAFNDDIAVSPMKLQRLLYFVASEYAKITGSPLLGESFQAWQYGPVVRSVYDEFHSFGGGSIRKFAKDAQGKSYRVNEKHNPALTYAIDRVWQKASNRSPVDLSRVTHLPESAWSKAYEKQEYIDDNELARDNTYAHALQLTTN